MKNIKFFAAAFAAITLMASCSKNGEIAKDGEPAFAGISITLQSQDAATRATNNGSAQEQLVNKVAVYVIDDNTGRMDTKEISSFVADGANKKANEAIPTTAGSKTIYVVANPTAALSAALVTAADVKSKALALTEAAFVTEASGSLSTLVMSGKATATVPSTARTAEQALASPTLVALSRNVAKIAVKLPATLAVSGGAASNIRFGLAAKAKASYLASQTNTALYTVPASPNADYFNNNFSPRTGLTYKNVNAYSATYDPTAATALFALEHKPQTFMEGNTTQIVISATYVPAEMVLTYTAGGAKTTGAGTAGSFYVHKATQVAWKKAAYDAAIADGVPAADFSAIYQDGTSYYQVPVKGAGGAKGVARNNYYELTINKISGFGDPTENGGITDPTTVIPEDSNIAVTLAVSPWEFIQWVEEIQ